MYVLDEKADEVVAKKRRTQPRYSGCVTDVRAARPRIVLLVNAGLTFGWMGSSLAVYGAFGNTRVALVYYLVASLVVVTTMSTLIYLVLRGHPRRRARIFVYALALTSVAVLSLGAALAQGHHGAVVVGVCGLIASGLAARCIASANYALLAAFFRAKRSHGLYAEEELRRLRTAGERRRRGAKS